MASGVRSSLVRVGDIDVLDLLDHALLVLDSGYFNNRFDDSVNVLNDDLVLLFDDKAVSVLDLGHFNLDFDEAISVLNNGDLDFPLDDNILVLDDRLLDISMDDLSHDLLNGDLDFLNDEAVSEDLNRYFDGLSNEAVSVLNYGHFADLRYDLVDNVSSLDLLDNDLLDLNGNANLFNFLDDSVLVLDLDLRDDSVNSSVAVLNRGNFDNFLFDDLNLSVFDAVDFNVFLLDDFSVFNSYIFDNLFDDDFSDFDAGNFDNSLADDLSNLVFRYFN